LGAGDVNYDTMGNITYYKLGNRTINYTYNSQKQLAYTSGSKSYNFNYDAKGNVTNNGTRTFVYNTANQMVQSGGYYYTYDGKGKRVKEVGSAGTSYSFYGRNGKLMYRKANNQDIDYYYLGSKLVANKKGSTVTYLHSDYLGSPAAATNTSNAITDRMHYQPFGESIEPPKDDVGYTGHKFDTDLGLSYMQARYYDPVIGRFYSNDPVGFKGVHSFNRYTYANNNPYKYIDPDGREASSIRLGQNLDAKQLGSGEITIEEANQRFRDRTSGSGLALSFAIPGGAAIKGLSMANKAMHLRHLSKVLSPAQVKNINRVKNILHRNAKQHDFDGVAKELKGISTGFDHVTEMRNSVQGLTKSIDRLTKSLKNPKLDKVGREHIQNTIDKGQKVLDRMNNALNGG